MKYLFANIFPQREQTRAENNISVISSPKQIRKMKKGGSNVRTNRPGLIFEGLECPLVNQRPEQTKRVFQIHSNLPRKSQCFFFFLAAKKGSDIFQTKTKMCSLKLILNKTAEAHFFYIADHWHTNAL